MSEGILITNKKFNTSIKLFSLLAVCLFSVVGIVYYKASIKVLILLSLFLFFYVLVPGYSIIKRFDLHGSHISTAFSRSFFAGFALNIALYYLAAITGLHPLLYIVGPCMSSVWIISLFKKEHSSCYESVKNTVLGIPASAYLFFSCVYMYSMITTQYIYISPEYSAFSAIKLDFGFHAGIINALSAGYPPQNPWIDGRVIHYHYFAEMLLSISSRMFNLPSEELLLSGTPVLITPVFSISMYAFFKEFSNRNNNAGLYCLFFHFSNMFMLKSFPNSWFLYHIYSNINNTGLGLSCFLTALPIIKGWDTKRDEHNTVRRCELFFFISLIAIMTGTKGPIAVVLIGSMIGSLLLGLILRDISISAVIATTLSTLSFLLVYFFVVGSRGSNENGGSLLNLGEVTDIFFLKSTIQNHLVSLPRTISLGILFAVFAIVYLSAFFLPLVIGYLRELFMVLSKRKEYKFSRVVIYACFFVGSATMMILNYAGHSQVYFGFAALVLVPIISFWFFEDIEHSQGIGAQFVRSFFSICICISICISLMYFYSSVSSAIDYYNNRNENTTKYRNVSSYEYEGLIWIRDNSDDEDLIASDRYYSVNPTEYDYSKRSNNTHFAYAIYSCRRHYIEGSGFSLEASDNELRRRMIDINNSLYDPSNDRRGDIARELSIDYIIVSKRFNDVGALDNADYELCFTNQDMDIYAIKPAA